ncbi:heavy metal-binding domain-containing protein [Candidatus Bathyarchaeota archaeon]|nr:heavy metal-binding domain-containing protein [Candidatus Bathyarchaeota archaeon]
MTIVPEGEFKVTTTPTIPGYRVTHVYGIVSGLSPRTRGVGGVLKGALQSIGGGEITAFTTEIEKARTDAVARAIQKARNMGANALIGLDLETSDLGESYITLVSATGTAVTIEKEE